MVRLPGGDSFELFIVYLIMFIPAFWQLGSPHNVPYQYHRRSIAIEQLKLLVEPKSISQ
ncbi:hypothetical protein IWW34DRAFT_700814 [Fusarium oxysporum f. sp. albedinis]|nr:hypothetical protein IWW34DRAFT_700814 [Fusarium oxysporum f. sp. albedinis]